MSDSPFAAYANTILRFEVPSGELTTVPGKGNIKPAGTAVVQVTAMLLQARPPSDTPRPGVDSTAVYLEGFAVEPMALPSIVTPQSPCAATWNGRRGKFLLELTGRSPFGYETSTGDEVKGWFQVSSFAVEGDPYVPPSPTPTPTSAGSQILSLPIEAAVGMSALRVVAARSSDGRLIYASATNPAHAFTVFGLLRSSVTASEPVAVLTEGQVSDSSWNWSIGSPIFLGANGTLTQNAPQSGFLIQVATPITPHTIEFEIQEPILL